jgi:ferric-dicitrate binding protein FerR (iron transport regulator)
VLVGATVAASRPLAGEALFEVEPGPSRRFVVEAAGGEITARGAAFDVSTGDARAEITVTEHAVDVMSAGARIRVEAGRQIDAALRLSDPAAFVMDCEGSRFTGRARDREPSGSHDAPGPE